MNGEKGIIKGEGKKKIGNLNSLISGVWRKTFTPQEALYALRRELLYEINKNCEEALILDYLASVERHTITVNEFVDWLNKEKGEKNAEE